MIPVSNMEDINVVEQLSKTYKSNDYNIVGIIDKLEAVKQSIYLILNTERYEYIIYSWNYGVELKSLFGKPTSFVLPELKRRIIEALTQDNRITGVDAFDFLVEGKKITCNFIVKTIYGDTPAGVIVNV